MNPLTNVLTPRARGVLYAILTVLAIVFTAYQASDGNWLEFAGGLLTALLGLTAASNASPTPVAVPVVEGVTVARTPVDPATGAAIADKMRQDESPDLM